MLTPRLKLIADLITGKTAADIGTDHAFIPIELVKSGRCETVIASDVNAGPAEIAKNNIKAEGLEIEVRVGNGLSVLKPGETDDIIIAGMGGKLICEILAFNPEVAKKSRLILQPMNGQYELRSFLLKEGYVISHEDLALEGFKVYNVIVCDMGKENLSYNSERDLHIPSFLKNHIYYSHLKAKKIREFTKIISGYEKSKTDVDKERLDFYKKILSEITEGEV